MLKILDTYQSIKEKAKHAGFKTEELDIGKKHPTPLLVLCKKAKSADAATVYLSSGIHGDEPAGPLALEKLLDEDYFSEGLNWIICPILNPYGLANNCRENANGIDLNRDYRAQETIEIQAHTGWMKSQVKEIDFSIGLHEDWEAKGFYLYDERMELPEAVTLDILGSVKELCPIEMAEEVDGHAAKNGVIKPSIDDMAEFFESLPDWPEAFYLLEAKRHPHYTFETPTDYPLEKRVDAQCIAIKRAIAGFLKHQQ